MMLLGVETPATPSFGLNLYSLGRVIAPWVVNAYFHQWAVSVWQGKNPVLTSHTVTWLPDLLGCGVAHFDQP
jgi:hypothetical protein